jgi:hypothetical protein
MFVIGIRRRGAALRRRGQRGQQQGWSRGTGGQAGEAGTGLAKKVASRGVLRRAAGVRLGGCGVLGHEGLGEIKETGIRTVDCRETKSRVFAVLDRVPVAKRCRTVIAEAMPAKPACREGIWRPGCCKTSSAVTDASSALSPCAK